MYIVIFNYTSLDSEILTNSRGLIEEFSTEEDAIKTAKENIDGDGYRDFEILNVIELFT